ELNVDKIDISELLRLSAIYEGGNPFDTGYLRLAQDDEDALIQVRANGGEPGEFRTVVRLVGIDMTDLSGTDFVPLGVGPDSGSEGLTIEGTEEDDQISGSVGNDTISGLGGNDTIYGLAGSDIIHGGDGNDHIDGGTGAD